MSESLRLRYKQWFYKQSNPNSFGYRKWIGHPTRIAMRIRMMYGLDFAK